MKVFEIKRVNIFNVSLEFMQDTKEPNPVLFVEKKIERKKRQHIRMDPNKKECFVNQTTRIKIYANNGERLRSNEVESNDRRYVLRREDGGGEQESNKRHKELTREGKYDKQHFVCHWVWKRRLLQSAADS